MSATSRTLEYLRKQGYHVWIVEKTIPFRGIKLDAFGFMDILAYREDDPVCVAVQSTVGGEHARHIRKYRENPEVLKRILDWIDYHKFLIISWRKAGPRGKRKLWTARVEEVTAKTFEQGESNEQIRLCEVRRSEHGETSQDQGSV